MLSHSVRLRFATNRRKFIKQKSLSDLIERAIGLGSSSWVASDYQLNTISSSFFLISRQERRRNTCWLDDDPWRHKRHRTWSWHSWITHRVIRWSPPISSSFRIGSPGKSYAPSAGHVMEMQWTEDEEDIGVHHKLYIHIPLSDHQSQQPQCSRLMNYNGNEEEGVLY